VTTIATATEFFVRIITFIRFCALIRDWNSSNFVEFKLYVPRIARDIFSRTFNGGGCFGCRNERWVRKWEGLRASHGESHVRGRGRRSVGGG